MTELRLLSARYYPALYRLMQLQDFPDTPDTYEVAEAAFEAAEIYGVLKNGELWAAFILGEPENGGAFLDVICSQKAHGRWAQRSVLQQLHKLVFDYKGLRYVWVQPQREAGLKAAIRAGFRAIQNNKDEQITLLLTAQQKPKWLTQTRRN